MALPGFPKPGENISPKKHQLKVLWEHERVISEGITLIIRLTIKKIEVEMKKEIKIQILNTSF